MNITLLVEYLTERGGTARQALELARHLQDLGHGVQILVGVWDRAACFPDLSRDLRIHAASEIQHSAKAAAPHSPWRPLLRFGARASGAVYAASYAVMRKSYRRLAALAAQHATDSAILNPHDAGPAAWVAADITRRCGIPTVWQCNDPLWRWEHPQPTAKPMLAWLTHCDRQRVRGIQAITVLDTQVGAVVRQRFRCQPQVVHSGVDLQSFAELPDMAIARAQLGLPPTCRVSLVLTNLNSSHRRVEDAIDSHARGPRDVYLLLAAPVLSGNTYAAQIAARVGKSLARDRIMWRRQPLSGEQELRTLFAASDLFIFPNTPQTWGLAPVEAAAAGLAVVVSDGAGVSEVFAADDTAFIYRGGDVDALTAVLEKAWSDTPARQALAARGRAFVQASLSWRKYALAMQEVFARYATP